MRNRIVSSNHGILGSMFINENNAKNKGTRTEKKKEETKPKEGKEMIILAKNGSKAKINGEVVP